MNLDEIERQIRGWWKKQGDVPVREATTVGNMLVKEVKDLRKRLRQKWHDTTNVGDGTEL